jgi:hypothetical protein
LRLDANPLPPLLLLYLHPHNLVIGGINEAHTRRVAR